MKYSRATGGDFLAHGEKRILPTMNGLAEWQSFYVLVGSAAGALIGLQFVLLALVAESPLASSLGQAAGAMGTPTVVHFATSLLVAAVLSAPWRSTGIPAVICGGAGAAGIAYIAVVARRMRRQTAYSPDHSDWFFYMLLPLLAYGLLAGSAYAASCGAHRGLFGVGAATMLLLFIGIRNSWDSVTYHVFVQRPTHKEHRRG